MARPKQKKSRAAGPREESRPKRDEPRASPRLREPTGWNSHDYFLAGLIFLLTLAAYIPALRAKYIWDDNFYVTENKTLRNLAGLHDIWFDPSATPQYYPIVHTIYWIEYHLWGLAPFGYHLFNVLVHATSAVLLWRLLKRLVVPGAWLAGAILAVHPVHVETVAWITEHKNVLSLAFYLLAAHAWIRFSPLDAGDLPQPSEVRQRKWQAAAPEPWVFYWLSLVFFLLSLLSKTVSCSLPAAILLVIYWKRGRISMRDVQLLIPFFILGAGLGIFTAHMEKIHVRAEGEEWSLTFIERVLVAGRLVWFYAWKLIWPHPLIFFYHRWELNSHVAWQYLFPLATVAVVALLWELRNRMGRGALVAFLFFVGTLVPALGFFNVYPMRYSWAADHFQYHASMGLIVLFAAGLAILWKRFIRAPGSAAIACSMIVLVPLAVLTWRQSRVYYDAESLWVDTLAKNPSAWNVHNNLGHIRENQGRSDEAFAEYTEAVRLNPNDGILRGNLANMLRGKGRNAEALDMYKEASRLKPDWAQGHLNYGSMLYALNRVDEAIAEYREAVRVKAAMNSYFAEAQAAWALALVKQGKLAEAEEHYKEGLKSPKADATMYYNYGNLLEKLGRPLEAVVQYKKALAKKPDLRVAEDRLKVLEKPKTP